MSYQAVPLHPSQKDIYIDQLINLESPHYNVGGYLKITGPIDKEKLILAINSLPEVFDVFKLRFDLNDAVPAGYMDDQFHRFQISELQISEEFATIEEKRAYCEQWVGQQFSSTYQLKKELVPVTQYLIEISEDEHWFFFRYHHLVMDGFGLSAVNHYVANKYKSLVENQEVSFNYASYVEDITKASAFHASERYQEEGAYWKRRFEEAPGKLLQRKYRQEGASANKGESTRLTIDGSARQELSELISSTNANLQQLTMAALMIYYSRISNESTFVFGIPQRRRDKNVRNIAGTFSGILPFIGSYEPNMKLTDLIKGLVSSQRNDYRYQHYLLGDLSRSLNLNSAEDALLEIVVNNATIDFDLDFGSGINAVLNPRFSGSLSFPIELYWFDLGPQQPLEMRVDFQKQYFKKEEIELWAQRLLFILKQFRANLDQDTSVIDILPPAEKELLHSFNNQQFDLPVLPKKRPRIGQKESNVISLFEKWAVKTADTIALVFENQSYTYRELNEKANQLAHYLRIKGVKPDQLVGLCIERSLAMVTGILGIWKAGGAYVPIDPANPEERISYLLEDSGVNLIVSSKLSRTSLPDFVQETIISLDECELLAQQPVTSPENITASKDLSYVIYTSGSTGKPKGVLVEHRGMLNHLYAKINELKLGQDAVVAFTASYTFDISVWQIFCALLTGGRTVIYPSGLILEPSRLIAQVEADEVNILEVVPSYLAAVLQEKPKEDLQKLRYLLVTGEVVSQALLAQWFVHPDYGRIPVVNAYGPTEASDDITHHFMYTAPEGVNVPLGRPVQHLRLYVLNTIGQLCPLGAPGEICVSGVGVSRGYLNREELTREKFIADPFHEGERMYKTGDLGRWLPDGTIEYLGRIDDQVKIRGYRIELGEIEHVLDQHPDVIQNTVIAKTDMHGIQRLVGYIVAGPDADREVITSYMRGKLPEYMVPLLVILDKLPLTANGKIDKNVLPEPEGELLNTTVYTAPRNAIEQGLADIWQELLKADQIGIYDNFFELGGHSLLVMRMIAAIRKTLNSELVVKDLFTHPTIAGLSVYMQGKTNKNSLPAITIQPKQTHVPLSFSQERLWFIDRLEGSTHYHLPAVLRLKGRLNINALQSALQEIINRHQVLRTVITEEEGIAWQQVLPADNWKLSFIEKTTDTAAAIASFIHHPFDLSADYMLKAGLIGLNEEENLLVVVMHHIASDGWSSSIIVQELSLLYAACSSGNTASLKPLTVQYTDYAIWQRTHISGEMLQQQQDYWSVQLAGAETLQLPVDFQRPAIQSTAGAVFKFNMDRDLTDALNQYSQQQGATLFMTLLSAFQVLLYRYSGQQDITVGTLVAGRTQQEIEELVGFFINTLAIRSDLSGEPSFDALLQQVKTTLLEGYEHQDMPFEKALETVVNNRDLGKNPLFQVMFVLQNMPEMPSFELGDLTIVQETVNYNPALLDLYFTVFEKKEGLILNIGYCTDLFCEETIARMAGHYEQLLRAIVVKPSVQISKLPMLTTTESDELLAQLSGEEAAYPKESNVIALFDQWALKTPDAIATLFAEQSYTYRELHEKANQLAHMLMSKGVKKEVLVGLCIGRTLDMITGILGIWKAGGAYVPIDPLYPAERIDYLLNDSGVNLVVSDQQSSQALPAAIQEKVILLDKIEFLAGQPVTSPQNGITSPQLSYVIYTSGSTGKPKGVLVEHGGMLNHLYSKINALNLDQDAVIAYTASYTFDISVWQMFCALLTGGCTVVYPAALILEPAALITQAEADQINILELVPSYLGAVLQESPAASLKKLRYLLVTGEAVSQSVLAQWFAHPEYGRIPVVNAYGPTEASDDITHHFMYSTPESSNVPLGKTIQNLHIYILDTQGQLCPLGVAGEICVSGIGVSRGYLNREELTREKFIADPFRTGNKLYKTGDLGRSLKGGIIEYLGRIDDQVKIRGYRIELGEIEYVLNQHNSIEQSVVVAKSDEQGVKRLVAYIVLSKNIQVGENETIIAYLKEHLPEYMIPALISLDHLPLTANGKIDKKALPEPEGELLAGSLYTEPRNETESILVNIWQELLKAGQIGIHDNFFAMGGHSLLVMRLIAAIRKKLSVELAVKDVFSYATIAELSAHMEMQQKKINLPAITAQPIQDYTPLSFSQERLWFIDKLEGSIHYHIPGALRLTGQLNQDTLQYALQTIISRHEVLRTVIRERNGIPYQQVLSPDHWELATIDPSDDPHAAMVNFIEQPFDLAADYMLRAGLVKTGADEYLLVISTHHIASDGWSATVMVKELTELYSAYIEGRTAHLEPLSVQYKDYAIWQRTHIKDELLQTQLGYWKEKLSGAETLQLPTDFLRPVVQGTNGAVLHFNIPADLNAALNQLSQQQGTTLYTTLLAAFQVLLYRYSGQEDICVGTPVAGRTQQEIEDLVGFFVNTLAIRSQLDGSISFNELLQQLQNTLFEGYEYQDAPFEKVVDAVVKGRDKSMTPLFQVMFVLQNTPDTPELKLGDLKLELENIHLPVAKFDITFTIEEGKDGLALAIEYCTDLFLEDTIARMAGHYEQLLRSAVSEPSVQIGALPMLGIAESEQLMQQLSGEQTVYPDYSNVIALFEERVVKTPDATALVFQEQRYTYQQLNEKANKLAHYLISQQVKADQLVGLCIKRSADMITGILGVWKAGGAYVPIDPSYPAERIDYLIADSGVKLVISDEQSKVVLPVSMPVILLDNIEFLAQQPVFSPENHISSQDLSYVIYTSGSTGKPKGVLVEHRGMLNHLYAKINALKMDEHSIVAYIASYTFDISVWQMFCALLSGGQTVIYSSDLIMEPAALIGQVDTDHVNILELVPSYLAAVLQENPKAELQNLNYLMVTGEAVSQSVLSQWFAHPKYGHIPVINAYGPTEASDDITHHLMYSTPENGNVPLGKTIQNLQIYILDGHGQLCPEGVPGEICVSGIGVSRGYLNREALTREKFIADPFRPGHKMYKTGDLGRSLTGGVIEYLGRIDDQVKIRGYRIELGEIEHVLNQHAEVAQSVVIAKSDEQGGRRLIGYIVADLNADREDILAYLKEQLPEYMVPVLIRLDQLPLTANGKIDKKALPEPDGDLLSDQIYVAPRDATEQLLAQIWQDLLQIKQVGIYDDFFDLGGHSLLIMRLASAVLEQFNITISIRNFFDLATIDALAQYINNRQAEESKKRKRIKL
ncbi:amino acid adenylation domain-containing protein [Pedobacter cryoconitis]|uniref:Amino acid adenylation domain-containing protein n=1 Tax=Pedobacter cryoconitis TaxID=188932 RepID=A0A7W8ZJL4_9SPHI|nr:non-ribosomal peptide synthetase [Pedobacter cryoconitis]MBB5635251.1 amino acid adenylation domain-containing protein [Pedobacter cryoconitis]